MRPQPILPNGLAEFLASYIQDDLLFSILSCQNYLKQQFGSKDSLPFVLFIGDPLPMSKNCHIIANSRVVFAIDDKMVFVFVNIINCQDVILLLHEIRQPYGAIVLLQSKEEFLEKKDRTINHINTINKICNITSLKAPLFLLLEEKPSLLLDIENKGIILGLDIKGIAPAYLREQLTQFLDNLYRILITQSSRFSFLSTICSEQEIFLQNLSMFSECMLDLEGMYFYTQSNGGLCFCDNLFLKIYNSCAEAKYTNAIVHTRTNYWKKMIFFILLSLSMAFLAIKTNNTINHYMALDMALQRTIAKSKDNIRESINVLSPKHFNSITQITHGNTMKKLNQVRSALLLNYDNILQNKTTTIFNPELFTYSPIETRGFYLLRQNVKDLLRAFCSLYDMHEEGQLSSSKLHQYKELVQFKITSLFTDFFSTFDSGSFFLKLEEVNILLNMFSLNANASLDDLYNLLSLLNELKIECKSANNIWWLKGKLGPIYDTFLLKIQKTPLIGKSLVQEITYIYNNAMNHLKQRIVTADHILVGPLFMETEREIQFSSKLKEFHDFINNIIHEPILKLASSKKIPPRPTDKEVVLWDLDTLTQIQSHLNNRNNFLQLLNEIPFKMRNIIRNLANSNLSNFIFNTLVGAQRILSASLPLEEKAININKSIEILRQITSFAKLELNSSFSFVYDDLRHTNNQLIKQVNALMEQSIFTNYRKLKEWKGEDLVPFLFQVSNAELPLLFSRTMKYFKQLRDDVLNPILITSDLLGAKKPSIIQNLVDQISAHEKGEVNAFSAFENFLVSLPNWKIEWRENLRNQTAQEEFIRYHHYSFQSTLINRTNAILFERSKQLYNNCINTFNKKILGNFPFGASGALQSKELIGFLQAFNDVKELIYSDKQFMNSQNFVAKNMHKLDSLNSIFIINNDRLNIRLKMQYHYEKKGSKNINLIPEYETKVGQETYREDMLEEVIFPYDSSYKLKILIAESSVMKISSKLNREKENNWVAFSYSGDFAIFQFIEEFFLQRDKNNVILRIIIPLENKVDGSTGEIFDFLCLYNFPELPKAPLELFVN